MKTILVATLLVSVALLISCHSMMRGGHEDADETDDDRDTRDHKGTAYDADFDGITATDLP